MADVLKLLKSERDALMKRVTALEGAIGALAGDVKKDVTKTVKKVSKMSAAGRKRIAAAQKKRWAAIRAKAAKAVKS